MAKPPISKPPVIPCEKRVALKEQIEAFAEVLKTEAHKLGVHGLSEEEFYSSGLLSGAIQRIRGQYSATMFNKRDFVARVLSYMEDGKFIKEWKSAGSKNRHDYSVTLPDGRISVIELKGCLDGNNTAIFERPSHAQEFIIWSVCSNTSADPRLNVWSGIHTRLGAEMIENEKQVDGLIVWDWICGTVGRPCPKLARLPGKRLTTVGQFQLTPPCIYLFPKTVPSVRNNPNPEPHKLEDVGFLKALNECFGGFFDEINRVRFLVAHKGGETVRTTSVERGGVTQHTSRPTPIRRR
jgi:hypothetical protein